MSAARRNELAAVFAGGCAGVLVRAALIEAADPAPGSFPWATFAVNLLGAALLGWLAAHPGDGTRRQALWGAGFCGALTTFSTLQVEVIDLADSGRGALAVVYVAATVLAGLAAVRLARGRSPA